MESTRKLLADDGITVLSNISEFKDNSIDVISLFHVIGHLDNPLLIISK